MRYLQPANYELIKKASIIGMNLSTAKRSATDQTTVYVRFSEQFLSVTGVTATTVKDRAVISYLIAIFSGQSSADVSMDLLSLLSGSSLTCTDSPYRLVSQDDLAESSAERSNKEPAI